MAYHTVATSQISTLWTQLCLNIETLGKDPLLIQSVARSLFEMLLKKQFGCDTGPVTRAATVDGVEFNKDELNALHYACGYMALKLLRKYKRKRGKKFDQFEMCLGEMAVMGEPTDFTQYTTEWMDKVNRGGLFPLNDEYFRFFCTVEGVVCTTLPRVVVSEDSNCNNC